MKAEDVPQDDSKSYDGQRKLLYAVNNNGDYQGVTSTGWETESFATQLAVDDLNEQTQHALSSAQQGLSSPLAYHMLNLRFDIASLSQSSGYFQWQIKRHYRPEIFNKLSDKKLKKYADVMNITIAELKKIPEKL